MKESEFGFEYTWEDLKPIRPLQLVVHSAQALGALTGILISLMPGVMASLWGGGAIATFPGFLLGLALQFKLRPAAISENKVMVRRMGLVALAISTIAVFILFLRPAR